MTGHAEPRAHLCTLAEVRTDRPCVVCKSALEVVRAGDTLRNCRAASRDTDADRQRVKDAELVWNAVKRCAHTCTLAPAPRQREAS